MIESSLINIRGYCIVTINNFTLCFCFCVNCFVFVLQNFVERGKIDLLYFWFLSESVVS